MTLRVLVVEDEWPARNYLVELVQQTGAAEVVAAVATVAEARQALAPQAGAVIDVAFVDVQLAARSDDLSGIAWVREACREPRAPMFVLATAYKQHAIEAYELGVSDYLVKPFTAHRVAACIQRLRTRTPASERAAATLPLRIAARRQRKIVFLDLTLSAIATSFGRTLVRVHRNWLVNANLVLELERDSGDMSLFVGTAAGAELAGVRVPVAKERATEVRELLMASARGLRQT